VRYYYNYQPFGNKIIINCTRCLAKMRVPTDKGKLAVACPRCGMEFKYNPNSILHTLQQVFLLAASKLPGKHKKLLLAAILAIAVLSAVLVLILTSRSGRGATPRTGPFTI